MQAQLDSARRQLDGVGRVVLRASGTEPVVRVTVEAADAVLLEDTLQRLARAVATVA